MLAIAMAAGTLLTINTGWIVLILGILSFFLGIFYTFGPFVFIISNLMLANNICDLEQDIKNDRLLLPYYVGVKNSLLIFRLSYYGAYLFIIALVPGLLF